MTEASTTIATEESAAPAIDWAAESTANQERQQRSLEEVVEKLNQLKGELHPPAESPAVDGERK